MKLRRVAAVVAVSSSGVFVASVASAVTSPLIQNAAIASATSSFATTGSYSPSKATGAKTQNSCGDSTNSWKSSSGNSNGVKLKVTFTNPVVPTQIKIWMNVEPKSLVKVEVAYGTGSFTTVFSRTVSATLTTGANCSPMGLAPHTLTSSNATLPNSLINKIRLTFDELATGVQWAGEVDAVQLTGNNPANMVASSITGMAKVGKVLTAQKGTWIGSPSTITYAYAWVVCNSAGLKSSTLPAGCSYITGATTLTHTLTLAQLYKYIRVRVAATNSTSTTYLFSATTAQVAPAGYG